MAMTFTSITSVTVMAVTFAITTSVAMTMTNLSKEEEPDHIDSEAQTSHYQYQSRIFDGQILLL